MSGLPPIVTGQRTFQIGSFVPRTEDACSRTIGGVAKRRLCDASRMALLSHFPAVRTFDTALDRVGIAQMFLTEAELHRKRDAQPLRALNCGCNE